MLVDSRSHQTEEKLRLEQSETYSSTIVHSACGTDLRLPSGLLCHQEPVSLATGPASSGQSFTGAVCVFYSVKFMSGGQGPKYHAIYSPSVHPSSKQVTTGQGQEVAAPWQGTSRGYPPYRAHSRLVNAKLLCSFPNQKPGPTCVAGTETP